MNKEVDLNQLIDEVRKGYMTGRLSLYEVLKQLDQAGINLYLIPNTKGQFACALQDYAHFVKDERGTTLRLWIPAAYWQDTRRKAVLYTLDKLHKSNNIFIIKKDQPNDSAD